jgi:hypothetical protein
MPKAPTKITAARALYMLDRAMRERLLDRAFGTEHLLRATKYFQEAGVAGCIYCDSPHVERWDHLISVRAGGATILGNMVPACQPCDDSKGSKDYRDWLSSSARCNPMRENSSMMTAIIRRIEAYQKHFSYSSPVDFISSLTLEQRAQYSAFAAELAAFRTRLATFGLFAPASATDELEEDDSG